MRRQIYYLGEGAQEHQIHPTVPRKRSNPAPLVLVVENPRSDLDKTYNLKFMYNFRRTVVVYRGIFLTVNITCSKTASELWYIHILGYL